MDVMTPVVKVDFSSTLWVALSRVYSLSRRDASDEHKQRNIPARVSRSSPIDKHQAPCARPAFGYSWSEVTKCLRAILCDEVPAEIIVVYAA